MDENFSYCQNLVKQEDRDRFLVSMFAPAPHRPALWALYAFNIEIAKTREIVTETSIGLMRILWWREGIQEIYKGSVKDNPVLKALQITVQNYNLPLELFENLTYAREFDVEDRIPETTEGLLKYCEFIHAPLLELSAKIIGEERDVKSLAVAYALIGLLRNFVSHAKQGRVYFPEDKMMALKLSKEDICAFKKTEDIIQIAKNLMGVIPETGSYEAPFFKAYKALVHIYKKQIERNDYDLMNRRLLPPPFLKALRVWKAATF